MTLVVAIVFVLLTGTVVVLIDIPSKPRKQKGMTVIKYPLYRFFCRSEDAVGFIAKRDRAETI